MPKRSDIKNILLIGSGPIVIRPGFENLIILAHKQLRPKGAWIPRYFD